MKSCKNCSNYSEFKEPRLFDGYAIYGKCFKKGSYAQMHPQGLNVYISESSCKEWTRDPAKSELPDTEAQLNLFDSELLKEFSG